MGLVDKIKADVKKSGQSRGKFTYVKEGQKQRVRFLTDMDDGFEVTFHDSFEKGVNVPCQEMLGKSCKYCEDADLRTRSLYVWSVWNYDAEEVQLFMFAVNNCSPVPSLMAMYENYGTLTDRDYIIGVNGKRQNKTYSVIPADKAKFRNSKAKPFSEKAMLDMLSKAYPADDDDDDEEYEASKNRKAKPKTKPEVEVDDDDWGDDEEAVDYEEMSPKELYALCIERDIEAGTKKPAKYYINLLEEYDEAQDDWGDDDDDDDDDWDEE